ncbi:MAG: AbrB/MazE/SpoVT family DNA-binding domain-containing protein [Candidatus Lokiarchaeota archaeon]|nr:AbrB/MazE/SpoVT family DNA-binding domain-containing protein [Candidatus Lokiarchaeota archaeon]
MIESIVKVSKKGMISLPAAIRKAHHIQPGQSLIVTDNEDGSIRLDILPTLEEIRKNGATYEVFKKTLRESLVEDARLER